MQKAVDYANGFSRWRVSRTAGTWSPVAGCTHTDKLNIPVSLFFLFLLSFFVHFGLPQSPVGEDYVRLSSVSISPCPLFLSIHDILPGNTAARHVNLHILLG